MVHKVGGHRDGGSTALASRSALTKSTTWWVTNRFQSGSGVGAVSPWGTGAWICSQSVTVWPQKVVPPRRGSRLSRVPYFSRSHRAEGRLALGAVALAAVLVGKVPQNHPGMAGKPLGQGGVHGLTFPVRGGVAVVWRPPVSSRCRLAHPADFRVLFAHPHGLGAREAASTV